ncbi:MAG: SMI1/KNR4 family protein [Gemmataceae bacterium]|nr:SMI1/KNR4 family protein [Gemmataceae bacterium]
MSIFNKSDALELKYLVELLAKRDIGFRVFGSGGQYGHNYRLLPTLHYTELIAFERKHGIQLPDDYRQYLTHVANGGAGPSYGITSLEYAARESTLDLPFPWTERTELATNSDFELWDKHPGFLELCHLGCGYYYLLIVNGMTKGMIWHDILAATNEIIPLGKPSHQWYREWVDEKLRCLDKEPLLDKITIGMPLGILVENLGPVADTWFGSGSPPKKFVCFQDAIASFVIDENDLVKEMTRFNL